MKFGFVVTSLIILFSLTGCQTVPDQVAAAPAVPTAPPTAELQEELADKLQREMAARRRLDRAAKLYGEGRLLEAQYELLPLMGKDVLADEVDWLAKEIQKRRSEEGGSISAQLSEQSSLYEVDRRLRLPASYGRTITISPLTTPLEMPEGPMEKLINQKVSMHLAEAEIKTIIMELSRIDGFNLIADKALSEAGEGEEMPTLTIRVSDVPLKEILSYIARNMGIAFHLGENVVWVTRSDEPYGGGQGPKLETRIYRLRRGFVPAVSGGGGGDNSVSTSGGEDEELMEALDAFLADSPEGSTYRIFKNRNVLIVKNTIDGLRTVEELIREFDREPLQVLIEARYVTVSQNDLYDLGVDIEELDLDGRDPDTQSSIMTMAAESILGASTNNPNITTTGIIGNHTYRLLLSALEQKSSTNTISAPRVTVLNNQTANIRRGSTVRYYTEVESSDTIISDGGTGNIPDASTTYATGDIEELELGIELTVRVNIGNDAKRVMLGISSVISQLEDAEPFKEFKGGGQLPQTSENTLSTSVAVDSGETVVLGGMITNAVQNTVRKVPILGDIPLLGFLFRHTTETSRPVHLIIFVTASIVHPSGEFARVAEDAVQ